MELSNLVMKFVPSATLAESTIGKLSSIEAGVGVGVAVGVGVGLTATSGAEGPRNAKNQTKNATTTKPPTSKTSLFQFVPPPVGTLSPAGFVMGPIGGTAGIGGKDGSLVPGSDLDFSSSPSLTSWVGFDGIVILGPGAPSGGGVTSFSDCFST